MAQLLGYDASCCCYGSNKLQGLLVQHQTAPTRTCLHAWQCTSGCDALPVHVVHALHAVSAWGQPLLHMHCWPAQLEVQQMFKVL